MGGVTSSRPPLALLLAGGPHREVYLRAGPAIVSLSDGWVRVHELCCGWPSLEPKYYEIERCSGCGALHGSNFADELHVTLPALERRLENFLGESGRLSHLGALLQGRRLGEALRGLEALRRRSIFLETSEGRP